MQHQYAAANADKASAAQELKQARWDVLYHRLRLLAAQNGIEPLTAGLIFGSLIAVALTSIATFVFDLNLILVLAVIMLDYVLTIWSAFWLLYDSPGERDDNRLRKRLERLDGAYLRCSAAKEAVRLQKKANHLD